MCTCCGLGFDLFFFVLEKRGVLFFCWLSCPSGLARYMVSIDDRSQFVFIGVRGYCSRPFHLAVGYYLRSNPRNNGPPVHARRHSSSSFIQFTPFVWRDPLTLYNTKNVVSCRLSSCLPKTRARKSERPSRLTSVFDTYVAGSFRQKGVGVQCRTDSFNLGV